ncbi:hypothetical protein JCM1840_006234 [Sporobolomyces johnsonii]
MPVERSPSSPSPVPSLAWLLNKAILVSTSFLIGAFFNTWAVDHALIWQGPDVLPQSVATSLRYYSHIFHAPPFYITTLSSAAGVALVASGVKLVMNPVSGLLFDGATFLLLASALSVYISNVLAALRYLPLDQQPAFDQTSGLGSALDNLGEVRLTEALQSVAASHMIIAVSLTGVLMLQGAQGFADRPSSVSSAERPAAGVVPATTTAPVPSQGEKFPEQGLHET